MRDRMVWYSRKRSKENQCFVWYGSGVGKTEKRIRSGNGPKWTNIGLKINKKMHDRSHLLHISLFVTNKITKTIILQILQCLPILWFVFLLIKMLKTLNEEIDPHHSCFAVAARDNNDVQTVRFHVCEQTNHKCQYLRTLFPMPKTFSIICLSHVCTQCVFGRTPRYQHRPCPLANIIITTVRWLFNRPKLKNI